MLSFAHRHRFHQADGSAPLATADAAKEGNKKNTVFWAKFILNVVANDILSEDSQEYYEDLVGEAIWDCFESEFGDFEDSAQLEDQGVLSKLHQSITEDGEDFGEDFGEFEHEHKQIIKRKCPTMEELEWLGNVPEDDERLGEIIGGEILNLPTLQFHKS